MSRNFELLEALDSVSSGPKPALILDILRDKFLHIRISNRSCNFMNPVVYRNEFLFFSLSFPCIAFTHTWCERRGKGRHHLLERPRQKQSGYFVTWLISSNSWKVYEPDAATYCCKKGDHHHQLSSDLTFQIFGKTTLFWASPTRTTGMWRSLNYLFSKCVIRSWLNGLFLS